MIKKVLIDDTADYDGWMVGEHPIKNVTYRKRVYWFGIKTLDHTYKLKENYSEQKEEKTIGFSKTNKQ